jgi:NADH dehydrogenase FAD-containing subunit
VIGIDQQNRQVRLAENAPLRYDALSLNVGSEVAAHNIAGAEHAWRGKPVSNLVALRDALIDQFRTKAGQSLPVVVVGGGATGCEVAANVSALAYRHNASVHVSLVTSADRLLPDAGPRPARATAKRLRRRGVTIETGRRIERIAPEAATDTAGRVRPAAATVLATGLKAPSWLHRLDLPVSADGLRVDRHLQAVDAAPVFGAGDCIDFCGRNLPKLGVFSVRQSQVLFENLLAVCAGEPMRYFEPQQRWLRILNLGHGEALAMRGRLWWRGRSMLWLKDRLDRGFLSKYRRPQNASSNREPGGVKPH